MSHDDPRGNRPKVRASCRVVKPCSRMARFRTVPCRRMHSQVKISIHAIDLRAAQRNQAPSGAISITEAGGRAVGTPVRLLARWRSVLRFRIGHSTVAPLDQLPDPAMFPDEFPVRQFGTRHFLGEVLGVAALKLFRQCGTDFPNDWSFDPIGQWLQSLACADATTDTGRLSVIHKVIDLGLSFPARLDVLNARLDQLTNADLHRMSMAAVQGAPVQPNVFEGLME